MAGPAAAAASPAACAAARRLVDATVGAAALRPAAIAVLRARGWALGALQPVLAAAAGPLGRFRAARELWDAGSLGQLLWIQGYRTAFADAFFVASSFCGNADFYLLLLPTMIWQGAPKLGRQITYMVCSSLILGNTMKDIVALPRPPSPPVWRPSAGAALDSSAFADFGFPSTHAMNALSNPLLIAAALAPWWRKSRARRWGVAAAALAWAGTISVGRVYLGAHSWSDVFAGHVLGALVAAFWVPVAPRFDAAVTAAGATGSWLLGGATALSVALFALYPSEAITGVSAAQNAELVGLFLGCMVGSRSEAAATWRRRQKADASVQQPPVPPKSAAWLSSTPRRAAVSRELLGFVIALSCRELTAAGSSAVTSAVFRLRGPVGESLALILRKLATYFVIALTMAGAAPAAFRWLGIQLDSEPY